MELSSSSDNYQTPKEFSDQVKEVHAKLRQLLTSETMEEHAAAVLHFAPDVVLDTPVMRCTGRDALRCAMYRLKFVASVDMDAVLAEVVTDDPSALSLRFLSKLHAYPKRTPVSPVGFLLPRRMGWLAMVDTTLASRKRIADISGVRVKLVNLGELPAWLRALNGWLWAGSALLTEPLWGRLVHLLGDQSYRAGKAD